MSLIKGVMSLTVDLVQQTTSSFLMDLPHRCNSKGPHSSISSILLPYPELVGLLTLSQYFSLSRFALRDLDFDRELQSMSRLCSDISERRMAKEFRAEHWCVREGVLHHRVSPTIAGTVEVLQRCFCCSIASDGAIWILGVALGPPGFAWGP